MHYSCMMSGSILLLLTLEALLVKIAVLFFFFFNDTATTEIYTLSLHDALPIGGNDEVLAALAQHVGEVDQQDAVRDHRSEEHTSELQSQSNLVCRLLLEKK